jgi:hypothetical protein
LDPAWHRSWNAENGLLVKVIPDIASGKDVQTTFAKWEESQQVRVIWDFHM